MVKYHTHAPEVIQKVFIHVIPFRQTTNWMKIIYTKAINRTVVTLGNK